jgi:hypothetical protein
MPTPDPEDSPAAEPFGAGASEPTEFGDASEVHPPLFATVNDQGKLRVLRVPISHANDRFFVLAAPYPLPNGTNKRIISRTDPIIPNSPLNAVRYYLAFLLSQKADNELMVQLWSSRIAAAEKLLSEVEAGQDVLIQRA